MQCTAVLWSVERFRAWYAEHDWGLGPVWSGPSLEWPGLGRPVIGVARSWSGQADDWPGLWVARP